MLSFSFKLKLQFINFEMLYKTNFYAAPLGLPDIIKYSATYSETMGNKKGYSVLRVNTVTNTKQNHVQFYQSIQIVPDTKYRTP